MKEEFLKTREGLKYLLKTFPSNFPIQAAIAEILTFKLRKAMNEIILNYADSTADTGEFDGFVQSESGKQYFEINDELP